MEMKEAAKTESDDQILQLPKTVVLHILSCLPFKDSVCTTILSKRWQNLWIAALTKLKFSIHYFMLKRYKKSEEQINAQKEHLIDFMEQTLRSCQRQKVQLEKLSISLLFNHAKMATSLERCISYAIGCNVSILKLGGDIQSYLLLPGIVFAAKELTYLKLWGWKLEFSSCLNVNLCCLKKLSLSRVSVDDEQMIQNLIAKCPVIEYLSLSGCRGSKGTLIISGLVNPKLVTVHVFQCEFERVKIEAQSIEDFEFAYNEPCEISMSACKNMRTLRLNSASFITDKWLHDHLSNFRHLEELALENCAMVETIKISSYRLERLEVLVLVNCDKVETIKISSYRLKRLEVSRCRNLVKVEIDSPNLRWFTYCGWNALSFSSSNALALEETYISLYPDNVDTLWYTKLTEFIGNFNSSRVLKLRGSDVNKFVKNFIIPEELRESLHPPLFNVKHLILELHGYLLDEIVEEIVDFLLWFSPHPLCIEVYSHCHVLYPMEKILSFEFLYKEIDNDGNPCCCSSLPITNWQHCIKEVKIETSGGWMDESTIKTYFDDDTNISVLTI